MSTDDRNPIRAIIADLRNGAKSMGYEIERLLAWDSAVSLAFQERTGRELGPGEPYTVTDRKRAAEILALYPRSGAE
jgi:hypothetical protein